MFKKLRILTVSLGLLATVFAQQNSKPRISLGEFFNYVSFNAVELSPDGNAVVINTDRADWDQSIFRHDLWLYRIAGSGGSLIQLTHAGHDSKPQWSPDSQWIAFLSERKTAGSGSPAHLDHEVPFKVCQSL